jgi:hypothetical protein
MGEELTMNKRLGAKTVAQSVDRSAARWLALLALALGLLAIPHLL